MYLPDFAELVSFSPRFSCWVLFAVFYSWSGIKNGDDILDIKLKKRVFAGHSCTMLCLRHLSLILFT